VDITDLKRAEELLHSAARTKDEFLATVSHELRTPLNAILGWTMMLRGTTDAARMERGLDKIDRNAKALARIIEDLLDFSRIARGELRVEQAPLNLRDVLLNATDAIAVLAQHKGISLEVQDSDVGVVLGDAMRLQQVITNLLTNAIKFTGGGGRIIVKQQQQGTWIVLTVQDTGVGIRPDLLESIFDPFRQAKPHGAMGLGLGLAIVRHIVDAHEGTVSAHSDGEGRGATFTVRLPAALDVSVM
jgi:signal transduction histidine kinase